MERTVLQSADELQMYVIFIAKNANQNYVKKRILELGGQVSLHLQKQSIMLALLQVNAEELLKQHVDVNHIGAVSFNNRIRKLKIKTGVDGKPLWTYKVDNNNNIRRVNVP